jgi:hypothetical protein
VIIPLGDEGTMVVVVGALDEMLLGAASGLDGLMSARGGAAVATGGVADTGCKEDAGNLLNTAVAGIVD